MEKWQRHLLGSLIAVCHTMPCWAETAPPYQDRLLPEHAISDDEAPAAPSTGLPRQWMTDVLWSARQQQQDQHSTRDQDLGLGVNGFVQTTDWGAWSVDATLYQHQAQQQQQTGFSGTLWQRQFWLNQDWLLNQSVGVTHTATPNLLRLPSRFVLPSQPLLGWSLDGQYRSDYTWQASVGRAGQYSGQRVRGFEQADGELVALAYQQPLDPAWQMAGMWLSTRGALNPDPTQPVARTANRTDAGLWSVAWQPSKQRLQLNLLHSQTPDSTNQAVWLDGQTQQGRYDHQYGLFWLDPNLGWGGAQLSQDAKGGYYRLNYQYARWLWNASLDQIDSVSGQSFTGQYANLYVRYQAPQQRAYGGQLAIRHDLNQHDLLSNSLLFGEFPNRLGTQRWQLDYQQHAHLDRTQLSLDQAIDGDLGQRLSLTASWLQEHQADATHRGGGFGMYGTIPFGAAWRLEGSARLWQLQHADGQDTQRDLNLSVHYQPNPTWQWSLSLYDVKGQQQLTLLDPLSPVSARHRVEDQSVLFTLRHVYQAGQTQAIIGGRLGDPYGTIQGDIFLDTNQDGIRNGSEAAVPDVTVMLDGRYMARTDAQGRFRFEQVRVGTHQLSMNNDELPLPWQIADARLQQSIEVRVRQTHHVTVGAVHPY